ncbi:PAS and ANTAR domain-containing protein [Isoptericola sp. NPDC019693]|uniref:PAS and ANTAR domain-containing protein n=1 Tax=Isoptericola sp. NPDC019693 TaxID=3364009 RepID=UPI0037B3E9B7
MHPDGSSTPDHPHAPVPRTLAAPAPALDPDTVDHALDLGRRHLTGTFRCTLPDETWWWSAETYEIHGFEPGEVVPTTSLVLAHKHPEDRERVRRLLAGARRTRAPFASVHRIMDARGRERTVVLTGQVETIPEAAGVEAIRGAVTDITHDLDERARQEASRQVAAAAESRGTIDQAKGMLTLLYDVGPDEAFRLLRATSNDRNIRLRDLAARVLEVARRDGPDARRSLDRLLRPEPSGPAGPPRP